MSFKETIRARIAASSVGRWIAGDGGIPQSAPASATPVAPVEPRHRWSEFIDHLNAEREHLMQDVPEDVSERIRSLWHHEPQAAAPFAADLPQDEPLEPEMLLAAVQENHVSFLDKFKTEFEKLFHVLPNWIHTGEAVISFAAPVVVAIIAQFDPPIAVLAAPIVAEIQSDLSTASVLVGDGTATPSLTGALNNVQANLNALLTAGHIKNAKIQADVTLVVNEIVALIKELPTSAAPVAPVSAAQVPPATA